MADKITVKNVYKVFGDDPRDALDLLDQGLDKDDVHQRTGQVVGVHDASFSVREGEIFVIMGLSGCGKSTLVRTLNRLIEPTRGSIEIDGRDVTAMSRRELIALRRQKIAMVFQSFALMPHLTASENAMFGLAVSGLAGEDAAQRVRDALETVGLTAFADTYPQELSGGMQQRVGLARALANDPPIMLMDEAFSALDPLIRTEMQDELVRLQAKRARTIVFISHDLDEAIRIGNRVAVMDRGRIVQIGTPDDIVQNPANDYVRSFFKGVDVSKVLSARDIVRDDQPRLRLPLDRAAAMTALDAAGATFGYCEDADGRFLGVATRQALEAAADVETALDTDVAAIGPDMPLEGLLGRVADAPYPVPVVDSAGRYLGAISKEALLLTLDRTS